MKTIQCTDELQTMEVAQELAQQSVPGDVICLHGDLGAGKSTFARAFIRSFMRDQDLEVPSPTFTLVQIYEHNGSAIYHFDLYRLEDPEEVFELGWEEAVSTGISLIEWPERAGSFIPSVHKQIEFEVTGPQTRKITITDHG